jgi:Flp pilus assembly protein TadG
MNTRWTSLRRVFDIFRKDSRGNVALMFAIAAVPVVGMVGAAVDFSHANSVKAAMQAALDSTALMLSRNVAGLTNDQLQTAAQNYFNAMFNRPEARNIQITATYTTGGGAALSVTGSATVPTTFMGVLGYNEIPVTDKATTKWGSSRLRVALVLDNTGSMKDDGKMGALQTATKSLLTQLKNAVSVDGDVYVSIVPFAKDVNIATTGYNTSWDSWIAWDDGSDSSWDGTNGSCSISSKSPRSTCVAAGTCSISSKTTQSSCTGAGTCSLSSYTTQSTCNTAGTCSISSKTDQSSCTSAGTCSISSKTTQSTCIAAGVCSNPGQTTSSTCTGSNACTNSSYTTNNQCTSHGGTWGKGTWTLGVWTLGVWAQASWTPGVWTQATWTPNSHTTWNGCFMDRGGSAAPVSDYDRLTTAPSSSIVASQFPAEQYNACPKPMMGLTYDWSAMNALVDSMAPNGGTNQPIGLVWGWQALVGGGPFTQPAFDSNYKYQQIIILLSDGLNTQDRWYGNGSSVSTSVDYRMYDTNGNGTCANVKAAGITVYTIQVNTGSDPTSVLLRNCASNSAGTTDHFFMLTSADQIVTTFNTIGTNLTKLRVAQ